MTEELLYKNQRIWETAGIIVISLNVGMSILLKNWYALGGWSVALCLQLALIKYRKEVKE